MAKTPRKKTRPAAAAVKPVAAPGAAQPVRPAAGPLAGRVVVPAPRAHKDDAAAALGWRALVPTGAWPVWGRLKQIVVGRAAAAGPLPTGRVPAAHLNELRDSVLAELKTFKGPAAAPGGFAGAPFSSVLLPGVKAAAVGRSSRWGWLWKVGLAAVVLAVGVVVVLANRTPPGAAGALSELTRAVERGQAARAVSLLDVPGLSAQVVEQTFSPTDLAVAEGSAAALLKPGLVANVEEELRAVLAARGFGAQPVAGGVLHGLWQQAGGSALAWGTPRLVLADARVAVADVPLVRTDTGAGAALRLTLENRAGAWQVVGVANLAETVAALGRPDVAGGLTAANLTAHSWRRLAVAGDTVSLGFQLANTGAVAFTGGALTLTITDAAGQRLFETVVPLAGTVAPGTSAPLRAQLVLPAGSPAARHLAVVPLAALNISARVQPK